MPVHHSPRALIAAVSGLLACAPAPTAPPVRAPSAAPPAIAPVQRCGGRDCAAVVAIAAGAYHACALRADHTVRCWGSNTFGQLGDGTRIGRSRATPVNGLEDAVAITAGDEFTCAVRAGGAVVCWGRNWFGELGSPQPRASLVPQAVPFVDDATAVAAGHVHACALRRTGKVACWGSNMHGQAAPGITTQQVPVSDVARIEHATGLVAAGELTCAVQPSGVGCWGVIDTVPPLKPPISDLVANRRTVCARGGGVVACWYIGSSFGLGRDVPQFESGPLLLTEGSNDWDTMLCGVDKTHVACARDPKKDRVTIAGATDAVALDAGFRFACSIDVRGDVFCWGDNNLFQLGDGTTAERTSAARVEGLR